MILGVGSQRLAWRLIVLQFSRILLLLLQRPRYHRRATSQWRYFGKLDSVQENRDAAPGSSNSHCFSHVPEPGVEGD